MNLQLKRNGTLDTATSAVPAPARTRRRRVYQRREESRTPCDPVPEIDPGEQPVLSNERAGEAMRTAASAEIARTEKECSDLAARAMTLA